MFGRSRQIKELEGKLNTTQETTRKFDQLIFDADQVIQTLTQQEFASSQTLKNVVKSEEKSHYRSVSLSKQYRQFHSKLNGINVRLNDLPTK